MLERNDKKMSEKMKSDESRQEALRSEINLAVDRKFPNRKKRRILVATIASSVVLAMVVAVIVVVIVGNQSADVPLGTPNEQTEQVLSDIQTELEEYKFLTEEQVIDTYQQYIDGANENDKIVLLKARITELMNADSCKKYGEQAISDAREIDGMLKTANSASMVYNVASYYNNEDVMQEYNTIIYERGEEEGMDMNAEVKG